LTISSCNTSRDIIGYFRLWPYSWL